MSGFIQSGRFGAAVSLPTVTWNPLDKHADISLSSGDLIAIKVGTDALRSVRATRGIAHTDNGYFETFIFAGGIGSTMSSPFMLMGISTSSLSLASFVGSDVNSWGYYEDDGNKYTNNAGTAYGSTYKTVGDIVGVAFKNGKIWFHLNGTWQGGGNPAAGTGEAFSGITGTVFPTASLYRATAPGDHRVAGRFNAANFTYPAPSGFLPWGG